MNERSATAVEKTKRAAASPDRPGEECTSAPGSWRPIVNLSSCEGKSDCVDVCPYDVFELRRIEADDFSRLGLLAKFKIRVHGMRVAYTPRADECRACGLCVVACPEDAIRIEQIS